MKRHTLFLLLMVSLVLTGCWDKLEVEDQLFPVTLAVDRGEDHRYRAAMRVPIPAALRAGMLGGQPAAREVREIMTVEADTVEQAMYILNGSVARRLSLRHLRGIIVGETLAREGMAELLAELHRNGDIKETAGFWIARGSATEVLQQARPTGEYNPGKINEGLILVQKGLHMAPPVRLQHVLARRAGIGVDPFAPVVGANRKIMGTDGDEHKTRSAVAGDLDRMGKNPMEVAGTAILRDDLLVGFLTVDETQGLLALRGEMGKAYVTIPDPANPGEHLTIRLQQENKPKNTITLTPNGPRVQVRLLFEGEVLGGTQDFTDSAQRRKVEQAAAAYMRETIDGVNAKLIEWKADPVGYGMMLRPRFYRWQDWADFQWRSHVPNMRVQVAIDVRIRRFGLIHKSGKVPEG